jgi:hypothetical protein
MQKVQVRRKKNSKELMIDVRGNMKESEINDDIKILE